MSALNFPDDRRYHAEHLWAKEAGDGSFVIGITDFAQDQLGEVIFIDLPEVGSHFDQGVSCAEIESAKVVSPAIIPLSGTVAEVNEALSDTPELVNSDPYGSGWLVRIKADDLSEATITAAEYQKIISA
ncbi:glycine cleavage system H protein [Desulfomicrobium apsheronum]|uniref:Glycine cleavage system H protein n=1 Tax=Desulfomicrobium apsheronum TaxID=52560 RepID=A0A1I4ABS9_9BACT|nr:glycine cleavage system protein GcvH [Desulfomicrobium apsheronum]SFK53753.1 glycine cleavage system H protein [Desulfomicrobium apsheronum]